MPVKGLGSKGWRRKRKGMPASSGWKSQTLEPNNSGGKARDNDSSRLGGFCGTVVER